LDLKREEAAQLKSFMHAKIEQPKAKKEMPTDEKGKTNSQTMCNHDIKYFRCLGSGYIASPCPNKRTMIMKHGEIKSESEKYDVDDMPPLKEYRDMKITYQVERDTLVIRHVLNV
jgi:hypothetical protein